MKVHYQDDRLLQLRPSGPWILVAIGLVMLAASPIWVWTMGQATVLSCKRVAEARHQCRLSRSVLGISVSGEPLEDLTGARVGQSTDSDGDTTYRVVLEAGRRDVPLASHTSSGYNKKAATVQEIERFLSDADIPSLEIRDAGIVGLIVSAVFVLIGVGMVTGGIQARSTIWTFDRDQDVVIKFRKGVLAPKSWEYRLSDVSEAIVTSSRDSDGDTTYRVELITVQGQRIPMTSWYSSGYRRKEETATTIRGFLDQG